MSKPSLCLHHPVAALCTVFLFSGLAANAQTPPATSATPSLEERLAAIRALKIDAATVSLIEHSDAATIPGTNGKPDQKLPARTVVKMVLNPAKGSNINVEIWLPDAEKWNARLIGLGNGGAAGHIGAGTLSGPRLAGYAAVTTDMGTAPNADSGNGNPEVWRDFGFRATHLMTVAGKQVATAYYGKAPEFSYFSGGSTGGQQALQEAQRYPEDYDGITGAVPAHCRTPLHAYFLWNDQILKKCAFTKSQSENIIAAGNEYTAPHEIPAIAGKFVSDPRCTPKDIDAVVALALKKDPTITPAQAEGLRKLFDGPRHAVTGERIFDGIPFGAALDPAHGNLYLFKWVFGADKNLDDINWGADIDTYTARLAPLLNAENADLSAFEKRGGKLILTSGTADSVVPYTATLDYYERVIEHFGSVEKAQSFCHLYIIPGLAHGGGPGLNSPPNLLETVRAWREKGTVPSGLTARRVVGGKTELEMPIYPYPTKIGWDTATSTYKPVDGPRGGVERVAERFRPPAAE